MKVSDSTFYVAEMDGAMHLFNNQEDAIGHLRENANNIDPESESVAVSQVTVEGDDWTIKQMPWQQIALRLLQEG